MSIEFTVTPVKEFLLTYTDITFAHVDAFCKSVKVSKTNFNLPIR